MEYRSNDETKITPIFVQNNFVTAHFMKKFYYEIAHCSTVSTICLLFRQTAVKSDKSAPVLTSRIGQMIRNIVPGGEKGHGGVRLFASW